ncbi:MAG: hypothetical protein PVJ21_21470 [Anaerolineales bacterium]|jgi:uncharacterized membrane protein
MKFSTFMMIYAVVSAVFGLGFVLMPGQLLPIYGVEPDAALRLIGQFFGAALLSLALLAWLARNLRNTEARRAIVLALLVGETLGFIFALIGQINGIFNVMGWSVVVVYLFFALGLAYFQFSKPTS